MNGSISAYAYGAASLRTCMPRCCCWAAGQSYGCGGESEEAERKAALAERMSMPSRF